MFPIGATGLSLNFDGIRVLREDEEIPRGEWILLASVCSVLARQSFAESLCRSPLRSPTITLVMIAEDGASIFLGSFLF